MHSFLEPHRWMVRILEPPIRNTDSFARSLGDGFVVYDAKTATGFPRPYLLRDADDAPIKLEIERNHQVERAVNRWLLGSAPGPDGSSRACAWLVAADGSIEHHPMWHESWGASSVGDLHGDAFVGIAGIPAENENWETKAIIWPEGPKSDVVVLDGRGDITKITATNGSIQVGTRWETEEDYAERAVLWHGREDSRINLHPEGYSGSYVAAISGAQQSGYVTERVKESGKPLKRAAYWIGSPESFVLLAPEGSYESEVVGCGPDFQIGFASYQVDDNHYHTRAILWLGTPAIAVDLHALLGDEVTESEVKDVHVADGRITILGDQWNGSRQENKTQRAVIWEVSLN